MQHASSSRKGVQVPKCLKAPAVNLIAHSLATFSLYVPKCPDVVITKGLGAALIAGNKPFWRGLLPFSAWVC